MFVGRVVGTVWATKKIKNLDNLRFLVIHPLNLRKEPSTDVVVAADVLGAGVGESVLCAYGRAARTAVGNDDQSIECAVVGIIDSIDVESEAVRASQIAGLVGHDHDAMSGATEEQT